MPRHTAVIIPRHTAVIIHLSSYCCDHSSSYHCDHSSSTTVIIHHQPLWPFIITPLWSVIITTAVIIPCHTAVIIPRHTAVIIPCSEYWHASPALGDQSRRRRGYRGRSRQPTWRRTPCVCGPERKSRPIYLIPSVRDIINGTKLWIVLSRTNPGSINFVYLHGHQK